MRISLLPVCDFRFLILFAACSGVAFPVCAAEIPSAVAAPDEKLVLKVHAEGAQVYECKAGPAGALIWQFREPVATLFSEGKTVGRHFAGPSWEATDNSAIIGKVVGKAPGATAKDIPWLKLDVAEHRGEGLMKPVTTVQRLETHGGGFEGACTQAGAFHAEPYAADYVFLQK
jgi:hypothetical protein